MGFEGTRTIGVEYLHQGTIHQTFVNQEVILSTGAFDSPKLLMLSGIGNTEQLSLRVFPKPKLSCLRIPVLT
ncbi:MAG: GMC family oxidoreductase N-terminal domain-containing protein [Nostoc sp.]